jgi:hypothetical protein
MILPGTAAWRRRAAVVFLAVGVALGASTLSRELPHEQTLIFHLDRSTPSAPFELRVSLTRVGESEAAAGMSINRDGNEAGDPRHTFRLPDGDYVVSIDLAWRSGDAGADTSKEGETSRLERVTLSGGETVVPLRKRVP